MGYTVKEFDNAKDVVDIVKTMTDPKIKFERKNKPKEMKEEELKSVTNRSIHDQCVKI